MTTDTDDIRRRIREEVSRRKAELHGAGRTGHDWRVPGCAPVAAMASEPVADVEAMMSEVRAAVAQRNPPAPHAPRSPGAPIPPEWMAKPIATAADARGAAAHVSLPRVSEPRRRLEAKDVYTLPDFLQFHDEEFVRIAYRILLRREPDASGQAAFLQALRTARLSKVEILGRMRFSTEGREAAVPLRGLLIPFAVRTVRRTPVLGRFIGIVQYLVRLPDIVRNHERLEATFFHRESEFRHQVDANSAETERALLQAGQRLDAIAREWGTRIDGAREQAIAHVEDVKWRLDERVDSVSRRVDDESAALRSALEQLSARQVDRAELEAAERRTEGRIAAMQARMDEAVRQTADAVRAELDDQRTSMTELRAIGDRLDQMLGRVHADLADQKRIVLDQHRSVAKLMDDSRRRVAATQAVAATDGAAKARSVDAAYAAFEERFRGAPEEIKARLAIYLPLIREAGAGSMEAPVLDVGCGRGDWLDLLRTSGLTATGVDLNTMNLDDCRKCGLDVVEGDAVQYLRSVADECFGAVTAMHVVEHLPFTEFVALLEEAYRVLRPGGVLVLETPNPENLLVGSCNFWFDPTHQRPLPPATLCFFVEAHGFERMDVLRLHPYPDSERLEEGEGEVVRRINQMFYGPQDFAVVARKP